MNGKLTFVHQVYLFHFVQFYKIGQKGLIRFIYPMTLFYM